MHVFASGEAVEALAGVSGGRLWGVVFGVACQLSGFSEMLM